MKPTAAQTEARYMDEIGKEIDRQLAALRISKKKQDRVLAYAINVLPPTEDGLPDIAGAAAVVGRLQGKRGVSRQEHRHARKSRKNFVRRDTASVTPQTNAGHASEHPAEQEQPYG